MFRTDYLKDINNPPKNTSINHHSFSGQPLVSYDEKTVSILNSNIVKLLGEINSEGSKKLTIEDAMNVRTTLDFLGEWLYENIIGFTLDATTDELRDAIMANQRIIECAKSFVIAGQSAGADS